MRAHAQQVVIIGCGNLAWHLANKLRAAGYPVAVHNHRENRALARFAARLKCSVSSTLKDAPSNADFYLLAVKDDAIASTANVINIANPRAILLHCSGTTPLAALGKRVHGTGVVYPVQTFSSGDEVDWSQVPLAIEGSDNATLKRIQQFAKTISQDVRTVGSDRRPILHLCAVMVSNFPNALYAAADKKLQKEKIDFRILLPLIRQTTAKLSHMGPLKAQTGPAKRGDKKVLKKHRKLLKGDPALEKIYRALTGLIQQQQAV